MKRILSIFIIVFSLYSSAACNQGTPDKRTNSEKNKHENDSGIRDSNLNFGKANKSDITN